MPRDGLPTSIQKGGTFGPRNQPQRGLLVHRQRKLLLKIDGGIMRHLPLERMHQMRHERAHRRVAQTRGGAHPPPRGKWRQLVKTESIHGIHLRPLHEPLRLEVIRRLPHAWIPATDRWFCFFVTHH